MAQFRALRSEQMFTKRFALMEAQHYGVEFGPSQVDINFRKEEKALDTFAQHHEQRLEENMARKRWRAIVDRAAPPLSWTKGQEYTRLWQQGVRPNYSPLQSLPLVASPRPLLTPEQRTQLAKERRVQNIDTFNVLPQAQAQH